MPRPPGEAALAGAPLTPLLLIVPEGVAAGAGAGAGEGLSVGGERPREARKWQGQCSLVCAAVGGRGVEPAEAASGGAPTAIDVHQRIGGTEDTQQPQGREPGWHGRRVHR